MVTFAKFITKNGQERIYVNGLQFVGFGEKVFLTKSSMTGEPVPNFQFASYKGGDVEGIIETELFEAIGGRSFEELTV